jgi:hypothetical protein
MAEGLTWPGKELHDLMGEAIREAGVGVTPPASSPEVTVSPCAGTEITLDGEGRLIPCEDDVLGIVQ